MSTTRVKKFKDREEAGKELAERLGALSISRPAVFGLPRSGVPAAHKIAIALNSPLDTVISHKIPAPGDADVTIAAIATGDIVMHNIEAIERLRLSQSAVDEAIAAGRIELERMIAHYHSGEFIKGNEYDTAIIVDAGMSTGITAAAAIASMRLAGGAKRIIFATPVCSEEAHKLILKAADDVICLIKPEYFLTVGEWYGRFSQVSDDEVLYLLHTMHDSRTLFSGHRQEAAK